MKKIVQLAALLAALGILNACAAAPPEKKFHQGSMPDPKAYNAHFGDMDADGNAGVTWEEFNAHFPRAESRVYKAVDLNADGTIDHDEWHRFKTAHGLKHVE